MDNGKSIMYFADVPLLRLHLLRIFFSNQDGPPTDPTEASTYLKLLAFQLSPHRGANLEMGTGDRNRWSLVIEFFWRNLTVLWKIFSE